MTRRSTPKPTRADLVAQLATELGVKLDAGHGGRRVVELADLGVVVEIAMTSSPLLSREVIANFREEALSRIADHDRGEWTDACNCQVRDRGAFSARGSTSSCKKPVTGVVVHKLARWHDTRGVAHDGYRYSFRCHVHLAKTEDEASVVFRDTLGHHALKAAREKRTKDIAERNRLSRMTPEERIVEDAKAYERADEVKSALARQQAELQTTGAHASFCNRRRSPLGKQRGTDETGDPNYECTCRPRALCECGPDRQRRHPLIGRCLTCRRNYECLECQALQGDLCSACYRAADAIANGEPDPSEVGL